MNLIGVCFWITTNCNLRCNICYADLNSMKDNKKKGYLSIIDKLHNFNFKKIAFTGGDPLLVNDLKGILKYAKSHGFKVALTTNALLINRKYFSDLENIIDEMSIPMDGFTNKTSNLHRTEKHNHNNVKDIIENSINSKIKLDVSTVVTKLNNHELFDILDYLEENKIYKWKCFQYSELDKPKDMLIDFNISNNEFSKIENNINNRIEKYNYDIQVDFRKNNTTSINSYINILPNGELLLTEGVDYINIGNIMSFNRIDDLINVLNKYNFSFKEHYKRHFRDL